MKDFEIGHERAQGIERGAVVRVRGSIDVYTTAAFRNHIERLRCTDIERFVLDMGDVTYINSTGISYILSLTDEGTLDRPSLVLVNVQPKVRIVFDMMKLGAMLPFCATVEEALGLMKGKGLPKVAT